ncbi:adenosylcobinamide-GDP ribazoletransferase [Streptosporangium canum]|uniref:adenosylcobinamide-GDP ribazoletransferase n=1 Tax=Streptosporangium canum TaxID=324952 RepID=UPI0037A35F70
MSETPPSERPSSFADGVRLAIGTLSVFTVRPGVVDRRAGGIAMTVAPFVGALIGAVAGAVLTVALWLEITPLLASVLAVATVALLTRGLHLDGLADLADGLGSGRPAGQALDIMKRSDIGPFGVVTLIFTLLAQVAALSEVAAAGAGPTALFTACVAGRLALTWACRAGVPSARPGGLGAMVAGTVRRGPALAVTALMLALPAALTLLPSVGAFSPVLPAFSGASDGFGLSASYVSPGDPGATPLHGDPGATPLHGDPGATPLHGDPGAAVSPGGSATAGEVMISETNGPAGLAAAGAGYRRSSSLWGPCVAVLAGLLAAWALRRRAVRRLGGITGDVLGALVEISTATTLVVYAVTVG